MSGSEERARSIVAEVFGPEASGHPQPTSDTAASSEPAGRQPATTAASRPAVSPLIARRAREVVDAVFDPPPPAPPPAPPPPSATTLAARRIVAEAEAAAAARLVEEQRARKAALEQERQAAAQRAREEAAEQARRLEEQERRQAEQRARTEAAAAERLAEEERAHQAELEQEAAQLAREEATERVTPSAVTPDPAMLEGAAAEPEVESDPRTHGPPQPDAERLFPPDESATTALFSEQPPTPAFAEAPGRGVPDPVATPQPAPDPHPAPAPGLGPDPAPAPNGDVDPAQVAARLAAQALEHRERAQGLDRDDNHTTFLEPSPGRRAGRWLLVTILAAVALAWLLPVTIAAVLELVSLS